MCSQGTRQSLLAALYQSLQSVRKCFHMNTANWLLAKIGVRVRRGASTSKPGPLTAIKNGPISICGCKPTLSGRGASRFYLDVLAGVAMLSRQRQTVFSVSLLHGEPGTPLFACFGEFSCENISGLTIGERSAYNR